jgi:hypothetical protein
MSAPAAKAFWLPVRRMAEMVGDWSKAWRAWFSSSMRGVERALRALGRLSVTELLLVIVLKRGVKEHLGIGRRWWRYTLSYSWSWLGRLDKLVGFH